MCRFAPAESEHHVTTVPELPVPAKCPRPCSECDEDHHWLEVLPDPDDAEDENLKHEAYATHGLEVWYTCKHCEAWVDDIDGEVDWPMM